MRHTHTKRIKNTIRKSSEGYTLTVSRSFVPNKGSKIMFREVEVNPIQNTVITYGTTPAKRDLEKIYETSLSAYYKTMHGYKKFKKKLNCHYKEAM